MRQEQANKTAFPRENENLADFLQRCQKKKSEVMLCPRCSSIFDKKAAEHIQGVRAANKRRENVDLRHDPRRASQRGSNQEKRPLTFRPPTNVPVDTWYKTSGRKRPSEERWHSFDVPRGSSLTQKKEPQVAAPKVAQVSSNYKGRNPMSRSQWRRYQRRRKAEKEAANEPKAETSSNVPQRKQRKPLEREPVTNRLVWQNTA